MRVICLRHSHKRFEACKATGRVLNSGIAHQAEAGGALQMRAIPKPEAA